MPTQITTPSSEADLKIDSLYLLLEDIRQKPELIADLTMIDQDVSVMLEKRGDRIRVAYLKVYDPETVRILEETQQAFEALSKSGYLGKI